MYPLATLLSMKDSGLRIRVQRELRERFLGGCHAQDKPAAQVIREFMRQYVERQAQAELSLGKNRDRPRQRLANDCETKFDVARSSALALREIYQYYQLIPAIHKWRPLIEHTRISEYPVR
jgi:hypothetical protein